MAVVERPDLTSLQDRELFEAAQREERAIVTENVPDFMPLDACCRAEGRDHWGLILILKEKHPRKRPQFVGAMVRRLDTWLCAHPRNSEPHSLVVWP